MNKWLFHQFGFTRSSLSATVALVSNFVEENVCVCVCVCVCVLHRQGSHPGAFNHTLPNRLDMSIACTQHVQSIE